MSTRQGSDSTTPSSSGVVQLSLFALPALEPALVRDEHTVPEASMVAARGMESIVRDAKIPGLPEVSVETSGEGNASPIDDGPSGRPRQVSSILRLREAIPDYLRYLAAQNRSKHTLDSFALDLKLLQEHLGNVPLTEIGLRDLNSFIAWVRLTRHNSPTSIRRKVASLKNFFAYLQRERIVHTDPSLRLIYPEIYVALPEFLEEPEVEALLDAAAEHDAWRALIALMLETGLKRDEVVALGMADVYLAADESAASYLVVRDTEQSKRLRSRRIEIESDAATLLRSFALEQPRRERFFEFSPRGVNFIVETCGNRARIITKRGKLTPQVLRETFAVRQMRRFVSREDALRAAGMAEDTLAALVEAHDLQLLRMLGLHEEPESAKKYRKLVRGWSSPEHS